MLKLNGSELLVTREEALKHVIMQALIIIHNGSSDARKKVSNANAVESRSILNTRSSLIGFEEITHGRIDVVKQLMNALLGTFEIARKIPGRTSLGSL